MLTGLITKSAPVKRTAFLIFILGALSAVAAMSTGERAEDVIEKIDRISKPYIEIHEEKAEIFAVFSYILGGISLLGLWFDFKQKNFSNLISIGTLALAIAALFFAQQTGTSGGEIRHTEIRSSYNATPPALERPDTNSGKRSRRLARANTRPLRPLSAYPKRLSPQALDRTDCARERTPCRASHMTGQDPAGAPNDTPTPFLRKSEAHAPPFQETI